MTTVIPEVAEMGTEGPTAAPEELVEVPTAMDHTGSPVAETEAGKAEMVEAVANPTAEADHMAALVETRVPRADPTDEAVRRATRTGVRIPRVDTARKAGKTATLATTLAPASVTATSRRADRRAVPAPIHIPVSMMTTSPKGDRRTVPAQTHIPVPATDTSPRGSTREVPDPTRASVRKTATNPRVGLARILVPIPTGDTNPTEATASTTTMSTTPAITLMGHMEISGTTTTPAIPTDPGPTRACRVARWA